MSLGDAATELHRGHNTAVFIFQLQVILFFQYDNMSAQLTKMFRAGLWRSTPRWAATCQQGSGLPRSRVRGTPAGRCEVGTVCSAGTAQPKHDERQFYCP